MLKLFPGDLFSVTTTILVIVMVVSITLAIKNRYKILKWGRLIAVFILVGTAISGTSAMRDSYTY